MTSANSKILNWALDHALSNSLVTSQRLEFQEHFDLIQKSHPSLLVHFKPYFSNWNPIFLLEGASTHFLRDRPVWTVRDGLWPLLFSLEEMQTKDFAAKLYVDKDLIDFIPQPWQKKAKSYEVASHRTFDFKTGPEILFLSGDLSPELTAPAEIEWELNRLLDLWGTRLRQIPIKAHWTGFDPASETFARIQEILKTKIQILSWENLQDFENLKGVAYHEINNKFFYADSFIKHWVLSRGAGLVSFSQKRAIGQRHPLSLYHSLQVF